MPYAVTPDSVSEHATLLDETTPGRRLFPHIIDKIARDEPLKIYATIPKQNDISKGWQDVTYGNLASSINWMAWWLEGHLGKPKKFGEETIAFMALSDIRYPIFFYAAMKVGYQVLITSPRNSMEGYASLIKKTETRAFFHSHDWTEKVKEINKELGSRFDDFTVPSVEEFIQGKSKAYSFPYTLDDIASKVALIFQTSGSTGIPKPIPINHGYFGAFDANSELPRPLDRETADWSFLNSSSRLYNAFPLFHVAGTLFTVYVPLCTGCAMVFQPTGIPLNEDLFLDIAKQMNLTCAALPPSFVEELSESPEVIKVLKGPGKVGSILYAGGPLTLGAGDRLLSVTDIRQLMGSTEAGVVGSLRPVDRKDWKYFEWNSYYGLEMQQIEDSDLYELIIPKNPKYSKYHCVFHTFPEISEWRTRDLFKRADHNPDLWIFVGRRDDVIVLSNGEKFNPVSMEKHIEDHELVRGALCCGQGRFQVGLFIEPDYTRWDPAKEDAQSLIDKVWPTVQEANEFSVQTGRIFKSKIMVSKPDKPPRRTVKGTLQRIATLIDYKREIDAMYRNSEEDDIPLFPEAINRDSLKTFVRECIEHVFKGKKLEDDADFYSFGFDSLHTVGLANTLRSAVETALTNLKEGLTNEQEPAINARVIYQNSSINKLAQYLDRVFDTGASVGANSISKEEQIDAMVEKYTAGLTLSPTEAIPVDSKNQQIILTGSTGSLGTYILHFLLCDANIKKIYCFNRSATALERTQKSLTEKGLSHNLSAWDTKVEFLHVNFFDAHFGIPPEKYSYFLTSVTTIIHNAWAVNFNHSLSTFESPHVKSVRNFVDFSLESAHRAHILFISSIATVGNYLATQLDAANQNQDSNPTIPEIHMTDPRAPLSQGYAESKHVSERILGIASSAAHIPSSVARVGQVSGPTTTLGKWNDAEWLPSIIKTSKSLGKIPASIGPRDDVVDWVPVDIMAKVILDLVETRRVQVQEKAEEDPSVFHATFHLTNPHAASWSSLLPAIQSYFHAHAVPSADIIPFEEWLSLLQSHQTQKDLTQSDLESMPALKIMEFMAALAPGATGLPSLQTTRTCKASRSLRELEKVDEGLMRTWLEQWGY
ncbi:MAG: putative NRPS-like protein biosynthetic cluster [Cirrosporium novae-zelandiae]|nr:MAG: putative NRPS-like protein biosynthetic cluster [Cirrosporium novae-zelandiae]